MKSYQSLKDLFMIFVSVAIGLITLRLCGLTLDTPLGWIVFIVTTTVVAISPEILMVKK